MAKTPEEKKLNNLNGGQSVDQTSTFVSSEVSLTKGLECYSRADVNNHYQKHRAYYQQKARDEVFIPTETKETRAFKMQAAKSGVQFVEPKAPDLSDMPLPWIVEKYESNNAMGCIVVTLKQAKDSYSYKRVTVTMAEFFKGYTTDSVQDQLAVILESTKSMWSKKRPMMQAESTSKAASKIKDDTSDPISKAANVVAQAKQMSPREMAEAMQNVAFRDRYQAAIKLLADIKAFK